MANQGYTIKFTGQFDISQVTKGIADIKKQIANEHIGEELKKQLQSAFNKLEVKLPELEKFANKETFSTKEIEQYQKLIEELQKDLLKFNEIASNSEFKDNFSIIDKNKLKEFDKQIQQIEDKITSFKKEMITTFEATNGKTDGTVSNALSELFSVKPEDIDVKFQEIINTASDKVTSIDTEIEKLLSGKLKYTGKELVNIIFGDDTTVKTAEGKAGDLTAALRKFIEEYRTIDEGDLESKAKLIQKVKDLLYGKDKDVGQVFNNPNGEKLFGTISEEDFHNLEALEKHLDRIKEISKEKFVFIDEEEAKKAKLTAEQTEYYNKVLNELIDTKKITIDQAKELSNNLTKEAKAGAEAAAAAHKQEVEQKALNATFGSLAHRIESAASAMTIFNKSMQIVRRAIKSVEDLDAAFTQIAIVSEQSSESAWKMFDEFNKLAKQYSITTKDLTEGAKLFYQQGLSAADTMKMVEASTVSAALGEVSMAEAANTLTAAIQGYNESAEVAMEYTDKIAMVGAVSAADFNELSVAMEKTASSAYTAGIDFDHLLGYLGKMIEVTREAPANLGTAMKTIIARFEDMKKDPMAILEDGVSANKVESALATIGIALRNSEGEFRALQDVMDELGMKWNSLTRNQQAYIATVAAGSRQQSRFLALMNNYDRTLDLITESQNSAGAAAEQYATYQDSIAAAQARLTASWENLYSKIVDNDLIKFAINGLSKILDLLSKVPPAITAIGVALGALKLHQFIEENGHVLGIIQKLLKGESLIKTAGKTGEGIGISLAKGFLKKTPEILQGLTGVKTKILEVGASITGGLKTAGTAVLSFASLHPILAGAIALAAGAVAVFTIKLGKQKKEYEDNIKLIKEYNKEADNLKTRSDKGEELFKTYDALAKKISLTEEEQTELNNTIKEIGSVYEEAIVYLDEYGNMQMTNADQIRDVIREEQRLAQERKKNALEAKREILEKSEKHLKKEDLDEIGANSRLSSEYFRQREELEKLKKLRHRFSGDQIRNKNYTFNSSEDDKEEVIKYFNELNQTYSLGMKHLFSDATDEELTEYGRKIANLDFDTEILKPLKDKINDLKDKMIKETDIDLSIESLFFSDDSSIQTSQKIIIAQIKSIFQKMDIDIWKEFFDNNGGSAEDLANYLQKIIDLVSSENSLEITQLFKDFNEGRKTVEEFSMELSKITGETGAESAKNFVDSFDKQLKEQLRIEQEKYKQYLIELGFTDSGANYRSSKLQLGEAQKRQDYIQNYLGENDKNKILNFEEISMEALTDMESAVTEAINNGDSAALQELPEKWMETWDLLGNIAAESIANSRIEEEIEKVAQDACNKALEAIEDVTKNIFSSKDLSSLSFDDAMQYYDYFDNEDGSNNFFDHATIDENGKLQLDYMAQFRVALEEHQSKIEQIKSLIHDIELNEDNLTEEQKTQLKSLKDAQKLLEKQKIKIGDIMDLTEDIQRTVNDIEIPNNLGKVVTEASRALKTSIEIGKEYEGIVKSAKELEKQMREVGHVDDDLVNELLEYGDTFADFFVVQDDGTIRASLDNVVGDYASAAEAITDIAKKRQEAELEIKRQEMLQEADVMDEKAAAYEELARLMEEYVEICIDNENNLTEEKLKEESERITGEVQAQLQSIKNIEAEYNAIQAAAKQMYENLQSYDTAYWSNLGDPAALKKAMTEAFNNAKAITLSATINPVELMANNDREGLIKAAETYRKAAEGLRQYANRLREGAGKLKAIDPTVYDDLADKMENAGKEGEKAGKAIADAVNSAAEAIKKLNDLVVELKEKFKDIHFNPEPFTELFEEWEHEWDYFFNINNLRRQIEMHSTFIDNIISSTYTSSEKKLEAQQAKIGNTIAKMSANNAYILIARDNLAKMASEIMEQYGEYYRIDPKTMQIYQHDAALKTINEAINAEKKEEYELEKLLHKKQTEQDFDEKRLEVLEAGKGTWEEFYSTVDGVIDDLSKEDIIIDESKLQDLESLNADFQVNIDDVQVDIDEIKEKIQEREDEITDIEFNIKGSEIKINYFEDYVDDMTDAVQRYQECWEELNSTIAEQQELLQELADIRDFYFETAINTEQQIYDAIVENYQKEIDEKKKQYNYLKQLDDQYLQSVRDNIDKERELREKANQQRSYQQNLQRAQLLEMDTSSAFRKELMDLKKEIEEQRQEMYDNLVNEQVEALEKEIEKRHELYDKELEALEEHLAYMQENAILLWETVNTIVSGGAESMMALLENTTEYINANELQRMQMRNTWEENVKYTYEAVENDTLTFLDSLISIGEANIEQKLPEVGEAIDQYTEVFEDAKKTVEDYNAHLEEYTDRVDKGASTFNKILDDFMQNWTDKTNKLTGYSEDWRSTVISLKEQTDDYIQELQGYYDDEGNVREDAIGTIQNLNEELDYTITEMYNDFIEERERYRDELEDLIEAIRIEIEGAAEDAANAIRDAVETAMANISYSGGYDGGYDDYGDSGDDNPGSGGDDSSFHKYEAQIEYNSSTAGHGNKGGTGTGATEAEAKSAAYSNATALLPGDALIMNVKYRKIFKKGGLADFTGLGWLDGTKSDPERVLSPKQTKLFETMVSSLERTANNSSVNSSFGSSYNIGDINTTIQVEKLDNDTDIDMVARKVENKIMNSIRNRVTVSI